MDLIYAPQFEKAGRSSTSPQGRLAATEDRQPRAHDRRDISGRIYGVPLYADVSALFTTSTSLRRPARSQAADYLAELRQDADKITALGGT
jgi:multiple sugar transport system substrate-binding protein